MLSDDNIRTLTGPVFKKLTHSDGHKLSADHKTAIEQAELSIIGALVARTKPLRAIEPQDSLPIRKKFLEKAYKQAGRSQASHDADTFAGGVEAAIQAMYQQAGIGTSASARHGEKPAGHKGR